MATSRSLASSVPGTQPVLQTPAAHNPRFVTASPDRQRNSGPLRIGNFSARLLRATRPNRRSSQPLAIGRTAHEHAGMRRPLFGIMWVTFGHLRPSGHIMPDHADDRGAVFLTLAPHDHPAYQPESDVCRSRPTSSWLIQIICSGPLICRGGGLSQAVGRRGRGRRRSRGLLAGAGRAAVGGWSSRGRRGWCGRWRQPSCWRSRRSGVGVGRACRPRPARQQHPARSGRRDLRGGGRR